MILLLAYLLLALAISFLCSMLESALLSVPKSHVAVLVERGSVAGRRLERMQADIDQPLAAILTLNTFAHTLGAAGVGAQAAIIWGDAWVSVVSVVVTLLILIFSEIIPKTLGAVHAKGLAPFVAWSTHTLIVWLQPAVVGCNWVSRLVSGRAPRAKGLSREEVRSIAHLALEEGAIDLAEATVLRNLIGLRDATVRDIMTPRTVVFTLGAEQSVREAAGGAPPRFARIPVIGASLDEPKGFVHRHDLFKALADERGDATLDELAKPLHTVPEQARLSLVLQKFIQRREHLFLVVDEYGASAGIVTLEDIIETLLGVEIIDETDTVEDMQALARELFSKRKPASE